MMEKNSLTLGSLFSGSGGFELAGSIFGIKPLWASEIEPFPIRVTKKNFPDCVHLGDISAIHGDEIEKVDIITGGSPCQDMSIAGKRSGLAGERSRLFNEQIRIVKEMRASDRSKGRTGKHTRCRWMLWENVPGSLTSNQKKDFQSVLTEIVRVADPQAPDVPIPSQGWPYAGCLMGEHGEWSVAYRTLDAKFWGVPQRRSRIYLIADFGGSTAPQILLERGGLSGDFEESRKAWERAAGHPEADSHPSGWGGKTYTLTSRMGIYPVSATLNTNGNASGRNAPLVMAPIPINDKATRCEGGGPTRNGDGAGNGLGVGKPGDPAPTLTSAGRHAVAYGISRSFFNQGENAKYSPGIEEETAPTLTTAHCPPGVAQPARTIYIARRFTPLEYGRLQGFPDWWTSDLDIDEPTHDDIMQWSEIFNTYWNVVGKQKGIKKPKTTNQIISWLKKPVSDSALYKMWGNGIALPCAMFVMEGIVQQFEKEGYNG